MKNANALPPHGVNKQLDNYDKSRPVVKCTNGTFVGNMEKDVAVWKGIPYAKVPVGDLRFKRAQDPDISDAIFDATYFGDSCLQPLSEEERSSLYGQSEDCLRLNVWNSSALTDKSKPVFVFIHGGGWASGGSSEPEYNGYYLAHYNPDIIVVTISYRFNVMGLINLSSFPDGDEYETSVNNGVYDQIQALKWIHQNIAAFGGDCENVTICGESAGGGAVSVLCVNEEARQMIGQNMRVENNPEGARVEAALKMVDTHEDYRYLKSFSSVFPIVQEKYPEVFEAYIMNSLKSD